MPDIFNIAEENKLIATGQFFWCHPHLGARPVSELSPDPRYCFDCFKLLTFEASLLRGRDKKPDWVPRIPKTDAANATKPRQGGQEPPVSVLQVDNAMQTRKSIGGILSQRGRVKKALPVGRIKELAGAGVSSRDIARQLELDGVMISYRTISRALAGVK